MTMFDTCGPTETPTDIDIDALREKYRREREKRLRPEGSDQYLELKDDFAEFAEVDPHTPVGQGWLRASSRELDPELSTPHRPYHRHQSTELLIPGEIYELDIEIWPSSLVVPPGHVIALTVRGTDYEYDGPEQLVTLSHFKGRTMKGSGIYLHDDPESRPADVYGGFTTVHTGGSNRSYLLLPVVPS